jgi:flagellar M-ring protein FliF
MNFFQKCKAVWQKISLVQRILLVAIVLTLLAAGALLTNWIRKPDMKMLYQQLDPEEAAKITDRISEQGVAYELRAGGTSIYVPAEKVYQLRLDMARDGLPAGQQGGYKIFDDGKIGVSPFVQNVNLKRALQDELAKSIQIIDGVLYARVHIVSSEQTVFTSQAGKTTASVVLKLRPGYKLSPLNIAAITHLVSGSVEGLTSENVTIIDSQGRLLSGKSDGLLTAGTGTVADYRQSIEQNLQSKAEEMLTTVLGPGRATVKVHAVIDTNNISTVTETYEPKGVATKEETTTNSETSPAGASGGGQPVASGGVRKDETIVTEYKVGKTVKQEVILPGEVKSLSVAAFVDLSLADANQTAAGGKGGKIMEVAEVEQIIKNALGLKETDALKVVDVKFNRPAEPLSKEELAGGFDYIAIARQGSLGIMAVCALLVLRMFKGAKKKAQSEAAASLPAGQQQAGLIAGEEGLSPFALRRQIAGALERDPEKVRQLFTSWIGEKGN